MNFMQNITINISLPDMVQIGEIDLKMMLAAKLYETKRLSLGQAADAAGLSKRVFIELLGNYGVSLFSQNLNELKADIENILQRRWRPASSRPDRWNTLRSLPLCRLL